MAIAARTRLGALVQDLGSQAEVARALRVDRSRVSRWLRDEEPDPENRRKLTGIEFILSRLEERYQPASARRWLVGMNPLLGDRRPIDLLGQGKVADVLAAIEAEEGGTYA